MVRIARQPSPCSEAIALLYNVEPSLTRQLARRLLWPVMGRIHAFAITKVRMRMLLLYRTALAENALVVGTTDKSEWTIGCFDPFGDGASDIALLRHHYKTQIRELARFLDVPSFVLDKPSSGDLAAGLPNEAVIGLTYERLDAVLWAIEHGLPDDQIVRAARVTAAELRAVRRAIEATRIRTAVPSHL